MRDPRGFLIDQRNLQETTGWQTQNGQMNVKSKVYYTRKWFKKELMRAVK